MKKSIIIISAVLLTGCGVWKPYSRPEIRTDNLFGEEYASPDTTEIAAMPWQELFADPQLQALIYKGLAYNSDLNVARLRVDQAESALKSARAAYAPSLNFAPSGTVSSFDLNRASQIYNVPITASWEIDILGRITNAKRRSEAAYEQSREYRQYVETRVITSIANYYYTLLMLDKQYEISAQTAEIWRETIEVMRLMKEAGMFNEAAIAQSEAIRFAIEASLTDLKESINQVENALAMLLFDVPQTIVRGELAGQHFPALSYGIPLQLLTNRPDVRMAELDLIQAHYAANEARANLYPNLVLGGSVGWTNSAGSAIVNPGKLLAAATASLTQPVFNRRGNRSQLEIARATQEQTAIQFQQTLLNAGAEVNNALTQIETAREKRGYLRDQEKSLETAVESTTLLMQHGSTTYLEILTARQSLLSAQLALVSNEFSEIQGIINLYFALGGGTDTDPE